MSLFWRRFSQRRLALAGLIIVILFVVVGVLAPLIAPAPSLHTDLGISALGPSTDHWFGTDALGRNILSEVLWGARTTLLLAVTTIAISTAIGIVVGSFAGYFGGWPDFILSRFIDMFFVIPRVLLAILLVAMLGSTNWNIVLALTVAFWPVTARLVRGEYIAFRQRQFVEAARAVGAGHLTIIFREILPSAMPIILVTATFLMSQAILSEAGLSFLGLADPNTSSWGRMVFTAQRELRYAPWTAIFPGLAILFVVLSLNLVGDGLNETINPKTARLGIARPKKKAAKAEPDASPAQETPNA